MGGMDIRFVRQDFAESVDWTIAGQRHEVLIWRGGTAHSKEFAFASGSSGRIVPAPSSVWVVPAGDSSTAVARRAAYDFARVTLPAALSASTALLPVVSRRDPLLHQLVDRIAGIADRRDAVARLLRESLLDTMRLHILDQYGERPAPPTAPRALDPRALDRVVEILDDAADADIDLRALAAAEGVSTDAFRRAFVRTFRTTPHRYLLDRRIARAQTLLVTTSLSMTEISTTLGFASPSHFAATFKRRVGRTPSAYRAAP
ncbi:AraC family transcriptional regulator [Tsukamurella pulmonis]|uniref:helix-turn-helix transcriptional regulator n=1 Tax=Tsukamurella pulmonis TaxID=47312 RepID=UPI001EDDAC7D|nr:helix-turn-helix transcriptional regulator [Tsukamurella pulmonis]BDD81050.1 AraC family transcriptional regulator [Tsukamurella pulmonis]